MTRSQKLMKFLQNFSEKSVKCLKYLLSIIKIVRIDLETRVFSQKEQKIKNFHS